MNSAVRRARVRAGGGNFRGRKRCILSSKTKMACWVMDRRFLFASRFNHSCTSRGISFISKPGMAHPRYHFGIILLSFKSTVNRILREYGTPIREVGSEATCRIRSQESHIISCLGTYVPSPTRPDPENDPQNKFTRKLPSFHIHYLREEGEEFLS